MTPEEIQHCCKDIDVSGLNEIIFKNVLTKAERDSLSEEEKEIRKRIHKRKSGFRYRQKYPEKYLKKVKNLEEFAKKRKENEKEKVEKKLTVSEEQSSEDEEDEIASHKPKKAPVSRGAKKEISEMVNKVEKAKNSIDSAGRSAPVKKVK
jgi:hypothetical protein